VAADDLPQAIAILYLIFHHAEVFRRRHFSPSDRWNFMTPHGTWYNSDYLQQVLQHAWRLAGVFLLVPSIPATLGNFLVPMMIGAKDRRFHE